MFNIHIDYLDENDEVAVVTQTTSRKAEPIEALFTGEDVLRFHELVRKVPIAEDLVRYAVRLAAASRPGRPQSPEFVQEWVSWGAGTRAAQFLVLGAKTRALLHGRLHVQLDDIDALLLPTLRHRILVSYRAEADGIDSAQVIRRLRESIAPPVTRK